VRDAQGNSKWFYSHGPTVGFALSLGLNEKSIIPVNGAAFNVKDFEGAGSGYSVGVFLAGGEFSVNRINPSYENSDWNFGGKTYNQLGFGVFTGLDFGVTWSRTTTNFFK